ncbi:MAG: ABC transporter ATP-binding protein [Alphaproteobacteria bacterium]|nr:MAG: ABC transporter ATP-binding protein [Alphaproteobacteria bacterium]
MGRSLTAAWKLRSPQPTSRAPSRGVAAFPRRPIPFLWHYVKRRPVLHFTALAAVLGAATAACTAQFGLKLIVDAMAQGAENITAVWWALAVFVGLLAGESVLWRSGSWLGYRAMLADKAEARLDLFDHLGGHSSRYFTDGMSGALASRVSSTGDSVQQVMSIVLFNIAPVCADFCAALVILTTVEWHLATALAVFVLLAVGTLALLGRRGTLRHRAYADRAAEVGGALVDVVSNIWTVKAFSAHSRERRGFAQLLQTETTAHRDSLIYIERMRVLHDLSLWLMAGAMLIWSLSLWRHGRISPGDVILTVAVAFRILHGSRDLAFAAVNATQFVSRIADAIQVIGEDHKVVDGPGARQLQRPGGSIAFERVDFSYPSGQVVFRGFSLRIERGQHVGLVGPSGAGKSTLIGLVQRLFDIDSGRLLIDDQDIRTMTQDSLRSATAVVPQEVALFHRSVLESVLENIRYARPEAGDDAVFAAAKAARCDAFIRALPQGYGTIVGERGAKLSGGQRQRLGIARALLKDAPIIVLDEATSALDTAAEIEIQRALDALMLGRTVLAIAHRLSTVARFDRLVVLQDGRIVEDGTPAELRRRRGFFDRMCRLQEGDPVRLAS